jgi:hypothetical protein
MAAVDPIHHFAHLYLLWLDEGDMDMPVDSEIRKLYTDLAKSTPACSILEETTVWLDMHLGSLSDDQICLAMAKAVAARHWSQEWLDAHRDNLRYMLVRRGELNKEEVTARDS